MLKKKLHILSVLFLLSITIIFSGCVQNSPGGGAAQPGFDRKPPSSAEKVLTYPIDLDGTGLFNKVLNIEAVTPGMPLPAFSTGLSQQPVTEKGVMVSGKVSGAEVFYTKIIDLNAVEGDLINFEVLYNDEYETHSIEVALVDIYNPSKTLYVHWYRNKSTPQYSYTLVGVNGLETARDNQFGTNAPRETYGSVNWNNGFYEALDFERRSPHVPFNFSFDMETNQVWSKISDGTGAPYMLLDTDDTDQTGTSAFDGFTTGEVYMKITFRQLIKKGAIVISQIAGEPLSSFNLTAEPNPNIKLDMDLDYLQALPGGAKGKNYPIPKPIEWDLLQGNYPIETTLFFGTEDISEQLSNYSFIPEHAGKYCIEYTAKDINNKDILKQFLFTIEETPSLITLELNYDTADFEHLTDAIMPVPQVFGGYGKLSVQTVYSYNGNIVQPDAAGKISLTDTGILTIKISATDYIGQIKNQTSQIEIPGKPAIVMKGAMPNALKAGSRVQLADFDAIDYGVQDGSAGYDMQKTITAGETELGQDRMLDVPASGVESLDIVYKGSSGSAYAERIFSIRIINPSDEGDITGYFVADGITLQNSEKGIELTCSSEENLAALPFAVSAEFMLIELETVTDSSGYSFIEVVLSDAANRDIAVAFRLYHDTDGGASVRAQDKNGEYTLVKKLPQSLNSGAIFSFYYDNNSAALLNNLYNNLIDFKFSVSGSAFKGFSSGGANISFKMGFENGFSQSQLIIKKVGNQSFQSSLYMFGDVVGPEISLLTPMANTDFDLGSVCTLPAAKAYDVLQFSSSLTLRVVGPGGSVIVDGASSEQETEVTFSLYGTYYVTYNAVDELYNENQKTIIIIVKDSQPPIIEVNGNIAKQYKTGDRIKLPNAVVSDNHTDSKDLVFEVMLKDSAMRIFFMKPGQEYAFTVPGKYQIIYYARDLQYNICRLTYDIAVVQEES